MRSVLAIGLLIWLPAVAAAQDMVFETAGEHEVSGGENVQSGEEERAAAAERPAAAPAATPRSDGPDPGTLGIGGEGLLSGFVGLHFRLQISDTIGILAAARFGLGTFNPPMANVTALEVGAGFGFWLTFLSFEGGRAGLIASLDFDVRTIDNPEPTPTDTNFDVGFGLGLFGELFLADFFSVHAQAGLRVYVGGRNAAAGATTASGFGLGGDALATLGFTFWFI
jgi:hypothetical protein